MIPGKVTLSARGKIVCTKEGESKDGARTKVGKYGKVREKEISGKSGGCGDEKPAQGKVREVECVVFVPATPGTRLRDTLQKNNDCLN